MSRWIWPRVDDHMLLLLLLLLHMVHSSSSDRQPTQSIIAQIVVADTVWLLVMRMMMIISVIAAWRGHRFRFYLHRQRRRRLSRRRWGAVRDGQVRQATAKSSTGELIKSLSLFSIWNILQFFFNSYLPCCSDPAIKFCCDGAAADAEEPEPVVLVVVEIVPAVELLFCHVNEIPPTFVELVATASLIAFIEKSWALYPW